jgi:hypothetical protein
MRREKKEKERKADEKKLKNTIDYRVEQEMKKDIN